MAEPPATDTRPLRGARPAGAGTRWSSLSDSGAELRFEDFLTFKLGRLNTLAHRVVTSRYLGRSGLALPEWRVLARLGAFPSLEMRELTRINLMDKAAISRAVDGLLDKGYAARHVDPTHARRRIIGVTPAGRNLLRRTMPVARREQAALLKLLSPKERDALSTILDKLTDRLLEQADIGPPPRSPPDPRTTAG